MMHYDQAGCILWIQGWVNKYKSKIVLNQKRGLTHISVDAEKPTYYLFDKVLSDALPHIYKISFSIKEVGS